MDTSIKQKKSTFDYHQLLLSWFSPSFPIGSFNFSHGLEAAIEYKFVYDKIIEQPTNLIKKELNSF